MVFVIVLAILSAVAAYGAARPNELWFQHYAGRVARAREARPGEAEFAFRRRTYLITAGVCLGLMLLALLIAWQSSQGPQPS